MSLINEALKKAQRQRAQEALSKQPDAAATPAPAPVLAPADAGSEAETAAAPARSHPRLIKRRKPTPVQNVAAVVLAVAVLAVAGLSSAILWFDFSFGGGDEPAVTQAPVRSGVEGPVTPAPVVPTPSTPDAAAVPGAGDVAPVVETPAPVEELPVVTFPGVALPPTVPDPDPTPPAPTVDETPAPTVPQPGRRVPPGGAAPTTPTTPESTLVNEVRIYEFLDGLRVTASRPSETDPRVMMEGRLFRVGDVVDRELGLRITAIRPGVLVFGDEAGREFTKHY